MADAIQGPVLKLHQQLYERSDGMVGHRILGVPALLLRTTGRRSGAQRCSALMYAADGSDHVVVASNGGSDRPPGWLHNVRAKPGVEIQIGRDEAFRDRTRAGVRQRGVRASVEARQRQQPWPLRRLPAAHHASDPAGRDQPGLSAGVSRPRVARLDAQPHALPIRATIARPDACAQARHPPCPIDWRGARREQRHPRRQPRCAAGPRGRGLPADLHRPAVQHRQDTDAQDAADGARRARRRTGSAGAATPTRLLAESSYRDEFDDYLAFLEPRLREAHRLLAQQRNALLPHRLSRGALLQGAARRDLRPRVLPERDHLGLRLRRADEASLAGEARHDPRLREGPGATTTSTPRRSTASPTWRRGW